MVKQGGGGGGAIQSGTGGGGGYSRWHKSERIYCDKGGEDSQ